MRDTERRQYHPSGLTPRARYTLAVVTLAVMAVVVIVVAVLFIHLHAGG